MSYYTFLCHYIVTLSKSTVEEERKKGETGLILLGSLFSLSMKKNVIPKVLYNQETKEASIQLYEIDMENIDNIKSLYENPKQVFTLTRENFDEISDWQKAYIEFLEDKNNELRDENAELQAKVEDNKDSEDFESQIEDLEDENDELLKIDNAAYQRYLKR